MTATTLGPIQTDEIKAVVFDFGENELEADETITGTPTVTVRTWEGADAAPGTGVLVGAATVVGRTVVQRVEYKQLRTTYLLQCTVQGSTGLQHTLSALLPNVAVT